MKVILLVLALVFVVGCTETLYLLPKDVVVNGQTKHYVFATTRDINGGSFNALDRYDDQGKLIARDAAMNPGILPALLHGTVAGAEMGAGIGAGLAAQGAANVVQNGGGGGGATSGATATQTQAQSQVQSQVQSSVINGAGGGPVDPGNNGNHWGWSKH